MPESGAKSRILKAAEILVSKNSITETTIAEVAKAAEVADSHIYLYFKNKEDLLFAVAYERIKEVYEQLGEQLQGIRDINSQLSRIIWHILNYNDKNSGYARILFDCFAKKNFYETRACHQSKKIANVITHILTQGVREEIFRSDINMRIVELAILGTIDTEAASKIMLDEIETTSKDLDDIMNILHPMITKKSPVKKRSKRELIITAAKKVLANKSYSEAKLSEIAKAAQIGEKTLYYYFNDKEDIVFSVSEDKFKPDKTHLEDDLKIKTPYDELKRFMENHFWMIAGDREFCKTFISQIQSNKNFYSSVHYNNYINYYKQLEAILDEGKKEGCFRKSINTRVYRNMFLGTFTRIALRWIIFEEKHSFDRFSEASQCIQLFLDAAIETK